MPPQHTIRKTTRFPTGSLTEHDAATGAAERADLPVVLLTGFRVRRRAAAPAARTPARRAAVSGPEPGQAADPSSRSTQVVQGDVLDPPSLDGAMHGVHTVRTITFTIALAMQSDNRTVPADQQIK